MDGVTFDSQAEALYYLTLKDQQKRGKIQSFKLQPKYVLLEGFTAKSGKKHAAITYKPDFEITELDGSITVVEIKGYANERFSTVRKLFENKYNHIFYKLIGYSSEAGFYDIDLETKRTAEKKRQQTRRANKAMGGL
jgi:hypothetical protein